MATSKPSGETQVGRQPLDLQDWVLVQEFSPLFRHYAHADAAISKFSQLNPQKCHASQTRLRAPSPQKLLPHLEIPHPASPILERLALGPAEAAVEGDGAGIGLQDG